MERLDWSNTRPHGKLVITNSVVDFHQDGEASCGILNCDKSLKTFHFQMSIGSDNIRGVSVLSKYSN